MKDFNIKKLEANDELDHINSFYTKNFQSIKNFFYESNLGFETCFKISKLTDEVIKKVYEKFLEEYCIKIRILLFVLLEVTEENIWLHIQI